jgi:hypothetical protein
VPVIRRDDHARRRPTWRCLCFVHADAYEWYNGEGAAMRPLARGSKVVAA